MNCLACFKAVKYKSTLAVSLYVTRFWNPTGTLGSELIFSNTFSWYLLQRFKLKFLRTPFKITGGPRYSRFWYSRCRQFTEAKTANYEGKLLFLALFNHEMQVSWFLRFEIYQEITPCEKQGRTCKFHKHFHAKKNIFKIKKTYWKLYKSIWNSL